MDYNEVSNLIDSTLVNREPGIEIEPQAHQDMAHAILDYAHQSQVTGQAVLQGFATVDESTHTSSTVPETPDNVKICYISSCNATTTYTNFLDGSSNPIQVTVGSNEVKFVILLWNTAYWEVMTVTIPVVTT